MVFRNPQEPLLALLRTGNTRQEGDEGHNMGEGYSLTSIARSKQKQAIGLSLRFSHLYVQLIKICSIIVDIICLLFLNEPVLKATVFLYWTLGCG